MIALVPRALNKKSFHISDILSVSTDVLLSSTGIDGYNAITDHIAGTSLTTIARDKFSDEARDFIRQALPWTKEVTFPPLEDGLTQDERAKRVNAFIQKAAQKYGEYHSVGQVANPPTVNFSEDIKHLERIRDGGTEQGGHFR